MAGDSVSKQRADAGGYLPEAHVVKHIIKPLMSALQYLHAKARPCPALHYCTPVLLKFAATLGCLAYDCRHQGHGQLLKCFHFTSTEGASCSGTGAERYRNATTSCLVSAWQYLPFGCIAHALISACAVAQGIIHRDIKPGNLRYDAQGRLKLLDFGLAVDSQRGAAWGCVGTLDYIAPEVLGARGRALKDAVLAYFTHPSPTTSLSCCCLRCCMRRDRIPLSGTDQPR